MNRPDEIDKLPRRFREYIQGLERAVADFQSKAAAHTKTPVYQERYDSWKGEPIRTYLDKAEVIFEVPHPYLDEPDRFQVKLKDEGIEVYASHGIVVVPGVSNVVRIVPYFRPEECRFIKGKRRG